MVQSILRDERAEMPWVISSFCLPYSWQQPPQMNRALIGLAASVISAGAAGLSGAAARGEIIKPQRSDKKSVRFRMSRILPDAGQRIASASRAQGRDAISTRRPGRDQDTSASDGSRAAS